MHKHEKPAILYITNCLSYPNIWNEFVSFVPLLSLIVHMSITVNLSSNCDNFIDYHGAMYLSIMSFGTFVGNVFYYLPKDSILLQTLTIRALGLCVGKSIVTTLNFIGWSYIRAKPYKCLYNDYSETSATIVFLIINGVCIALSWYMVRKLREIKEINKLLILDVET